MRTSLSIKSYRLQRFATTVQLLLIIALLAVRSNTMGQGSAFEEEKVDYLLRIYFSGENKDGLLKSIYIGIQELEEQYPTDGLLIQHDFLQGIQEQAKAADNACDLLDLIAAGIYSIDAAEAANHDVIIPSDIATEKTGETLASLKKVNRTASSTGNTARAVAWNRALRNKSGVNTFSKAADVSTTVSDLSTIAGESSETVLELGTITKAIFGGKDKPCKNVPKKDIQLGEHVSDGEVIDDDGNNSEDSSSELVNTTISISNLSFSHFREVSEILENRSDIREIKKAYSESLSNISVTHTGSTDQLADWIYDIFGKTLELVAFESGKINLSAKEIE